MFKRKIYEKLVEWKKESDGRTALLVEGARRIGKSTVVENFAKNEYERYILKKYSDRILWKYLVYTKDLCKDQDIICLPVYMAQFL